MRNPAVGGTRFRLYPSYAEGFVREGSGNLAVHATATFSMVGETPRSK